jgi:fimbrial isopeptide formation D2 family protein/LPXTG-motif cell wall-anchored protein
MKGKIRKLLSVVVATAMTLSCLSVPAFANSGKDSSGVEHTVGHTEWTEDCMTIDGHVYEVYQIFKGTVSNSTITNVEYGYNGVGTLDTAVDSETLANFKSLDTQGITDSEKASKIWSEWVSTTVIEPYSTHVKAEISKNSNGSYTVAGITEHGYYLIRDKKSSQQGTSDTAYTLYVAKSYENVLTFTPKGSWPTVSKTVSDTANGNGSNSAAIGDTLSYTITAEIPSGFEYYNKYYLKFTDTLSKGLTYKNDVSIKLYLTEETESENAIDVTKYFYKDSSVKSTGETEMVAACSDIKELNNLTSVKPNTITDQSRLVLTYTAVLNENAVVSGGGIAGESGAISTKNAGNTNSVYLTYSNNPNNSGTPSTDLPKENPGKPDEPSDVSVTTEAITNTYTMQLKITKVSASNNATTLSGAVFKLTGATNQVIVVEDRYYPATYAGVDQAIDDGVLSVSKSDNNYNEDYYLTTTNTTRYYKKSHGATTEAGADSYTTTAPTSGAAGYEDATDTTGYFKVTSASTLKGNNQTETSVIGNVDDNGVVTFTGLGTGKYVLSELLAPSGYEKMSDIEFEIAFDSNSNEFKVTKSSATNQISTTNESINGVMSVTITNSIASSLPSTGGIGTTIFYVAGTILVLGAAVALITRRRMKGEVK